MDVDEEQTHEEIWDDSALVDSWNQALDEYKVRHPDHPDCLRVPTDAASQKYHSIHAKGGAVEDILQAERE